MNVGCNHTFKLEHTRTDKGSTKHDWALFEERYAWVCTWWSSGDLLAGLCLMSKAGHWEYLLRHLVDGDNIVTMVTPLIFFLLWSKERGRTPIPKQDMNWEKSLLRGTHIPLPHLEFAKLQVYGVQVSFCSCSFIKAYWGVVVGVAHMFVGVFYRSFSLIFPWNG